MRQNRSGSEEIVRRHDLRGPVPRHKLAHEPERRHAIAGLCHKHLEHLIFVIRGQSEIVRIAVHLRDHLVKPPAAQLHAFDTTLSDLGRSHRTERFHPQ